MSDTDTLLVIVQMHDTMQDLYFQSFLELIVSMCLDANCVTSQKENDHSENLL